MINLREESRDYVLSEQRHLVLFQRGRTTLFLIENLHSDWLFAR